MMRSAPVNELALPPNDQARVEITAANNSGGSLNNINSKISK
jgi:hypothetical protein